MRSSSHNKGQKSGIKSGYQRNVDASFELKLESYSVSSRTFFYECDTDTLNAGTLSKLRDNLFYLEQLGRHKLTFNSIPETLYNQIVNAHQTSESLVEKLQREMRASAMISRHTADHSILLPDNELGASLKRLKDSIFDLNESLSRQGFFKQKQTQSNIVPAGKLIRNGLNPMRDFKAAIELYKEQWREFSFFYDNSSVRVSTLFDLCANLNNLRKLGSFGNIKSNLPKMWSERIIDASNACMGVISVLFTEQTERHSGQRDKVEVLFSLKDLHQSLFLLNELI